VAPGPPPEVPKGPRRLGWSWKIPRRPLTIVLGSLVLVTGIIALRAATGTTLEVRTDAELKIALERATGGESIVLRPGSYGFHYLPKPYGARVVLRGADRRTVRVEGFSTLPDADARRAAARILITNLTISPVDRDRDAVRINRGAHDIEIAEVTIDGGRHCLNINAYPYGRASWPHDITVRNSDLSGSSGDVVQITGGGKVSLRHNFIHDPRDNPDDHVDGIQAIGSEQLTVVGNSFTEPAEGSSGPNQAIILGRADPYDRALTVRRSYVANNLITEGETGYGENSITGRARFVTTLRTSPERYKLKSLSPAIDSGITTPDGMTPATDLDDLRRRGLPDRGAREFVMPAGS